MIKFYFNRFFVAKFPEFFERLQKLDPKVPKFEDLDTSESDNKSETTKTKSQEEKLDEARYYSVQHLLKVVAEILEEFSGEKDGFLNCTVFVKH